MDTMLCDDVTCMTELMFIHSWPSSASPSIIRFVTHSKVYYEPIIENLWQLFLFCFWIRECNDVAYLYMLWWPQQSIYLRNYGQISLVNVTLVRLGFFFKICNVRSWSLCETSLRMQCSMAQKILEKPPILPFTASLCWPTSSTLRFKISIVW